MHGFHLDETRTDESSRHWSGGDHKRFTLEEPRRNQSSITGHREIYERAGEPVEARD